MDAPYREHARPRVVIHGRIRLSAPLFGLFALCALCAPMFALTTPARVEIECERLPSTNVACVVSSPAKKSFVLVEPLEVLVEPGRLVVVNARGRDVLVEGDHSEEDLRKLAGVVERVHMLRSEKEGTATLGVALERRILVPGLVLGLMFLALSIRRRRVIVDHGAETVVAATMLGLLPIGRRRVALGREPSTAFTRGEGVVLVNQRGKHVLFEGRDDELSTLAERVDQALAVNRTATDA